MRVALEPKKDFIARHGIAHAPLVETASTSLQYAFAHFCMTLHAESHLDKATAFAQIEGARRFIDLWMNLGREAEIPDRSVRQLIPITNKP